jgi:transposase
MEIWTEVRRRVLTGELSKRAACKEYGLNWRTLEKMLSHIEPPRYRRQEKREQPVLGPHLAWIHEVLEQDKNEPRKQRHTAKRIFDRLKAERDCSGGYTVVKDAVQKWKATTKEVFIPLSHPPGEAQVDFGFAYVDVAGVDPRTAMAAMRVSSLDLVLKTYADEKHLDVTKAVNSLPAPPPMLEAVGSTPAAEVSEPVVPIVVPTSGNGGALEGCAGPRSPSGKKSARSKKARISRVSHVIPAKKEKRAKGLEPSTSSLGSGGTVVLTAASKRLTARPADGCTNRCTNSAAERDALAAAGRMIAGQPLTDADRVAIVGWLVERAGRRPSS